MADHVVRQQLEPVGRADGELSGETGNGSSSSCWLNALREAPRTLTGSLLDQMALRGPRHRYGGPVPPHTKSTATTPESHRSQSCLSMLPAAVRPGEAIQLEDRRAPCGHCLAHAWGITNRCGVSSSGTARGCRVVKIRQLLLLLFDHAAVEVAYSIDAHRTVKAGLFSGLSRGHLQMPAVNRGSQAVPVPPCLESLTP